jgi:hypothetical protein
VTFIWPGKEPIISHNDISELFKQVVSCAFKSVTYAYDFRPLAFSFLSPSQPPLQPPHFGTL